MDQSAWVQAISADRELKKNCTHACRQPILTFKIIACYCADLDPPGKTLQFPVQGTMYHSQLEIKHIIITHIHIQKSTKTAVFSRYARNCRRPRSILRFPDTSLRGHPPYRFEIRSTSYLSTITHTTQSLLYISRAKQV